MSVLDVLAGPWPWYVAGPLIGLTVPLLLILGNKPFGVSSNLRHLCAAICPVNVSFFKYDWRQDGGWNLTFVAGIFIGGAIAGWLLGGSAPDISAEARASLARLGI